MGRGTSNDKSVIDFIELEIEKRWIIDKEFYITP